MSRVLFTNLRVFIDDSTHPIYTKLTSGSIEKAEDAPFSKMPDLFLAAASLGYKGNVYIPITGKRRDIFVADAFNAQTQIPVLMALAYQKVENVKDLLNGRQVLNICEGWANGGIYLLNDQLMSGQGLRPLYRLIDSIMQI